MKKRHSAEQIVGMLRQLQALQKENARLKRPVASCSGATHRLREERRDADNY
jgi:hypothetical protein